MPTTSAVTAIILILIEPLPILSEHRRVLHALVLPDDTASWQRMEQETPTMGRFRDWTGVMVACQAAM